MNGRIELACCARPTAQSEQVKVTGLVDPEQARPAQLTRTFISPQLHKIANRPLEQARTLKDGLASSVRACSDEGPKARGVRDGRSPAHNSVLA